MKKLQFLLFFIVILILPLFFNQVNAAEVPDPTGSIYVQDFSGILSQNEKQELVEIATYLDDQAGAQIALLTIPSLEGIPIEEYAVDAFHKYELGDKKKNNGVLLLLALEDRKIYIEVGYGLEGRLPDGKVGRILDTYALPFLEKNDLAGAVTNTYKQLFNEVAKEYQLKKQVDAKGYEYGYERGGPSLLTILIITFVFLGIVFLDFRFLSGALSLSILRVLGTLFRFGRRGNRGPRSGSG